MTQHSDKTRTASLVKEAIAGLTSGTMMFAPAIQFDLETEPSSPLVPAKRLPIDTRFFDSSRPVFGLPRFQENSIVDQAASSTYLAAKRRFHCRRISQAIASLEKWESEVEFVAWTQEPLSKLKVAIKFLDDSEQFSEIEHEGNACEVMRQIRDSFLSRGWERYRNPDVRRCIVGILNHLATEETITADYADATMNQLFDLNLQPVAMGILEDDDEAEDDS